MSKSKISHSEKLQTVHLILEGKESLRHAAVRLGISLSSIQQWISIYKSEGEGAFLVTVNKRYSKELKEQAVLDYLCGQGSQQEICQHYGIRSKSKLQKFGISYQQARNYIVKYEAGGVNALQDRRGRPKPVEKMTELEKLRAENKILRAEKERAEMEASFLKKLDKIERRRG